MGGIIAHSNGHENVTNCLFDGSVSGGISSGAIIGYIDNNNVQVHNCLEKGTYNASISNMSFDDRSGIGNNGSSFTNNWSFQNWSEMNGKVVGSMPVAELVEKLGSDNWQVLDGEAVPIMHSKDVLLVYEIASGDVAGKSADEIMALLGGNWTKDANGSAVPYFTTTDLGEQVKTYGLKLRSDLFQRDDEQDYTLMFWFKTAQENGTLLANGAGKANDEGALHKFFIGFEDATLKYRTNDRMVVFIGDEQRTRPALPSDRFADGSVYFVLTIGGNSTDREVNIRLCYWCAQLHQLFTIEEQTTFTPELPYGNTSDYVPPLLKGCKKYPVQQQLTVNLPAKLPFTPADGDVVAAFAGNECRGIGSVGKPFTVFCTSAGEALQLRYYSTDKAGIYSFVQNVTIGDAAAQTVTLEP